LSNTALEKIHKQIEKARKDLIAYPPEGVNWIDRCNKTADILIPWLCSISAELGNFVNDTLNSSSKLRESWNKAKKELGQETHPLFKEIDALLNRESVLLKDVSGDVVSSLVVRFLTSNHPEQQLSFNGKSNYPDLYIKSLDYGLLPLFSQKAAKFGPALKDGRPARVPDGLEIKTCKGRLAVDCHNPHIGLHLVLLFNKKDGISKVEDVLVAFLKASDYTKCRRRTAATTVKYSFNGDPFISILKG
jgi:hypothetical protein